MIKYTYRGKIKQLNIRKLGSTAMIYLGLQTLLISIINYLTLGIYLTWGGATTGMLFIFLGHRLQKG